MVRVAVSTHPTRSQLEMFSDGWAPAWWIFVGCLVLCGSPTVSAQVDAIATLSGSEGRFTHAVNAVYASNSPTVTVTRVVSQVSNEDVAPTSSGCLSPFIGTQLTGAPAVLVHLASYGSGLPECYWTRLAGTASQRGAQVIVAVLDQNDLSNVPRTGDSLLAIPLIFVRNTDGTIISQSITGSTFSMEVRRASQSGQSARASLAVHIILLTVSASIFLVVVIFMVKVFTSPSPRVHPVEGRHGQPRRISTAENNRLHRNRRLHELHSQSPTQIFKSSDTLKEVQPQAIADLDTCAVCIENFQEDSEVRCLRCGHVFHKDCVDPWLVDHGTCPLCKTVILENVDRLQRGESNNVDSDDWTILESQMEPPRNSAVISMQEAVLMPFEQLFLWGTHRPIDVSPEDRFDVLLEEAEGWLWLQENQRLHLMQRNASSAPPTRSVTGQTVHSGRRSLELARAAPDLDDTASNEIGSIDSVIIQSADAVGVERVGSDIQRLSREPTDTSAGMEPALTADTVPREENSAITALNPGSVDMADSDTDLDSDLNLSSDESEAGDLDQTSRTVVLQ
eukprot:m.233100 g.233100  ORF g.233100 m.233100 type:complete len:565 (-) comp15728_c0_seq14:1422-3116(-)